MDFQVTLARFPGQANFWQANFWQANFSHGPIFEAAGRLGASHHIYV